MCLPHMVSGADKQKRKKALGPCPKRQTHAGKRLPQPSRWSQADPQPTRPHWPQGYTCRWIQAGLEPVPSWGVVGDAPGGTEPSVDGAQSPGSAARKQHPHGHLQSPGRQR